MLSTFNLESVDIFLKICKREIEKGNCYFVLRTLTIKGKIITAKQALINIGIVKEKEIWQHILSLKASDCVKIEKDEDYKRAFDNLKVINMSLQENKSLKHTNKSYKGIINKQNKVIDEMANYIANWDVEEDICKKVEKPLCNNETSVPVSYCVECVKQYFEKKVEEDIC